MNSTRIPQHKCASSGNASSRCAFCAVCGVYMSKSAPNAQFHRPARYQVIDPLRLDNNSVLTEMIKKQALNRYFNAQANHLNYRSELISFVEEVSTKLEYSDATFFLAVAILDALLSLYSVDRTQIKLVGFMALNLAAKIHENNQKIPELAAVVQLFENQFDVDEISNCENMLAQVLGYNLNIKTPHSFVDYFLSKGVVSDIDLGAVSSAQLRQKTAQLDKVVSFFLQASVGYYEFYKFTSIAVSTAVIACARKLMGFEAVWSNDLENLTQVSWDAIEQCTMMLYEAAMRSVPELSLRAIAGDCGVEIECPALLSGLKRQVSITTEATSEKDYSKGERVRVSEFSLYDSDEEEGEPARFDIPYNFNC